MTDMIEAQDEPTGDAYEGLAMSDLRKFAKMLGINAQRDWSKEDYIVAIKHSQDRAGFTLAIDANAPAPGHSRVVVHRDPTPGHKNNPVHFGVNGRIIGIPRGVEVDVPTTYVEAMKNAITVKTELQADASRDNPAGTYGEVSNTSYPYSVVATTPGKFVNPHDGRAAQAERKKAFNKAFGRWPTDGELKEAMRQKIIKDLA